jgi:hypothetical protein
VHGNELLAKARPDYPTQKRYERRQHTVGAFIRVGKISRIKPPPGYALPRALRVAADVSFGCAIA